MKTACVLKGIMGVFAFALGTIGIVLPLIPTTPLYLLGFWCFSNSPKVRGMIERVPLLRKYCKSNYS